MVKVGGWFVSGSGGMFRYHSQIVIDAGMKFVGYPSSYNNKGKGNGIQNWG